MVIDPMIFTAIGDVLLNLSAGWFGAAVIVPVAQSRYTRSIALHGLFNILFGFTALVIGYEFRILGI